MRLVVGTYEFCLGTLHVYRTYSTCSDPIKLNGAWVVELFITLAGNCAPQLIFLVLAKPPVDYNSVPQITFPQKIITFINNSYDNSLEL